MVKITYKGETRDIPQRYIPKSLTEVERKKQIKSIFEGTNRPKLKNFQSNTRSPHVKKFEKRYNRKITDLDFIYKNIISKTGVDLIMDKGKAAYFSSGSRPEVSKEAWAYARLAAVIMNSGSGGARRADKKIWDKYKLK